jgi:hypothetical protein
MDRNERGESQCTSRYLPTCLLIHHHLGIKEGACMFHGVEAPPMSVAATLEQGNGGGWVLVRKKQSNGQAFVWQI